MARKQKQAGIAASDAKTASAAGFKLLPRESVHAAPQPGPEILPYYRQLHEARAALNKRLVALLPVGTILEAYDRFDLLDYIRARGPEAEALSALLTDYATHHRITRGKNAVQRLAASKKAPAPDTLEGKLLAARLNARLSLFIVTATTPGVGVTICDAVSGKSLFVVDERMSKNAQPGQPLIWRIMRLPELNLSTGAGMSVTPQGVMEFRKSMARGFGEPANENLFVDVPDDLAPAIEEALMMFFLTGE